MGARSSQSVVGFQVAVGTLGQDRNRDTCVHVEKYIFDEDSVALRTIYEYIYIQLCTCIINICV